MNYIVNIHDLTDEALIGKFKSWCTGVGNKDKLKRKEEEWSDKLTLVSHDTMGKDKDLTPEKNSADFSKW